MLLAGGAGRRSQRLLIQPFQRAQRPPASIFQGSQPGADRDRVTFQRVEMQPAQRFGVHLDHQEEDAGKARANTNPPAVPLRKATAW